MRAADLRSAALFIIHIFSTLRQSPLFCINLASVNLSKSFPHEKQKPGLHRRLH
jgi:hypothetical protein